MIYFTLGGEIYRTDLSKEKFEVGGWYKVEDINLEMHTDSGFYSCHTGKINLSTAMTYWEKVSCPHCGDDYTPEYYRGDEVNFCKQCGKPINEKAI